MRTNVTWTRDGVGESGRLEMATRVMTKACLIALVSALGVVRGEAQVSVEFAEGTLAPAAQEMANAGVDGSAEKIATLIEIAQRYGLGYGISPDEVRDLLGAGYLAVRQIDCRSLDAKFAAAQRLNRALTSLAWLYAAGAGLSIGAPPVAAALGFGALVTGISATVAGWIAADIRAHRSQVKCTKGGEIEWFRRTAPEIMAALEPARWRFSSPHSCGA